MCSKVWRTEDVPAPDDPVTEMMGCLIDMYGFRASLRACNLWPSWQSPEQSATAKQRRAIALEFLATVDAHHSIHLVT
jgi:hypothetical protein